MRYVAIVKTAKDSADKLHKKLPAEYPTNCAEYDTEEEAFKAHPGCRIMSTDAYTHFQEGLQLIYNHVASKKPWWKFWGKK